MRKSKTLLVLLSLLMVSTLAVALGAGCGSSKKAQITNLDPSSGVAGTSFNIVRDGLRGTRRGNSVVHVGVKVADVVSWSNVLVVAKVPAGLTTTVQPVSILTGAGESNELSFLVIPSKQPTASPGRSRTSPPSPRCRRSRRRRA